MLGDAAVPGSVLSCVRPLRLRRRRPENYACSRRRSQGLRGGTPYCLMYLLSLSAPTSAPYTLRLHPSARPCAPVSPGLFGLYSGSGMRVATEPSRPLPILMPLGQPWSDSARERREHSSFRDVSEIRTLFSLMDPGSSRFVKPRIRTIQPNVTIRVPNGGVCSGHVAGARHITQDRREPTFAF